MSFNGHTPTPLINYTFIDLAEYANMGTLGDISFIQGYRNLTGNSLTGADQSFATLLYNDRYISGGSATDWDDYGASFGFSWNIGLNQSGGKIFNTTYTEAQIFPSMGIDGYGNLLPVYKFCYESDVVNGGAGVTKATQITGFNVGGGSAASSYTNPGSSPFVSNSSSARNLLYTTEDGTNPPNGRLYGGATGYFTNYLYYNYQSGGNDRGFGRVNEMELGSSGNEFYIDVNIPSGASTPYYLECNVGWGFSRGDGNASIAGWTDYVTPLVTTLQQFTPQPSGSLTDTVTGAGTFRFDLSDASTAAQRVARLAYSTTTEDKFDPVINQESGGRWENYQIATLIVQITAHNKP